MRVVRPLVVWLFGLVLLRFWRLLLLEVLGGFTLFRQLVMLCFMLCFRFCLLSFGLALLEWMPGVRLRRL